MSWNETSIGIASKRRRSRASVLHLTWMEAESCKSSCCRRGRMDEDWVTSSKTNMYLGSGLMLPSAVVMSSLSSMNCRIKHTTTLSPLSKHCRRCRSLLFSRRRRRRDHRRRDAIPTRLRRVSIVDCKLSARLSRSRPGNRQS